MHFPVIVIYFRFIMTNLIEEGSKVILYLGYNNLHVIKVKANEVYQTKFGALKHNDLVGKEFGSKIICTKGYIHALPIVPGKKEIILSNRRGNRIGCIDEQMI